MKGKNTRERTTAAGRQKDQAVLPQSKPKHKIHPQRKTKENERMEMLDTAKRTMKGCLQNIIKKLRQGHAIFGVEIPYVCDTQQGRWLTGSCYLLSCCFATLVPSGHLGGCWED